MSLQAANDFIDHANRDEAIRNEARANFKDVVNIGRKHGYDFTGDELNQALRERKGSSQQGADASTQCQCCFDGFQCQCCIVCCFDERSE